MEHQKLPVSDWKFQSCDNKHNNSHDIDQHIYSVTTLVLNDYHPALIGKPWELVPPIMNAELICPWTNISHNFYTKYDIISQHQNDIS